jgi:acyl dehydratase
MRTFNGIDELKAAVGEEIGVTDWFDVTQDVINEFADSTGDHQFIHVDPERAAQTPLGGTIAHGLLTLSLGPRFAYSLYTVENVAMALNYGYDKVRFPSMVPVDSKLRMRATITSVDDVPGGIQMKVTQTFEIDGGEKPVCVAESLVRVFGG